MVKLIGGGKKCVFVTVVSQRNAAEADPHAGRGGNPSWPLGVNGRLRATALSRPLTPRGGIINLELE